MNIKAIWSISSKISLIPYKEDGITTNTNLCYSNDKAALFHNNHDNAILFKNKINRIT